MMTILSISKTLFIKLHEKWPRLCVSSSFSKSASVNKISKESSS